MRRIAVGLLIALALAAPAVAKDVTTQVVIRCDCLANYPVWACEAFWWALC